MLDVHLLIDDDLETSTRVRERAGQLLAADLRRARVSTMPAPMEMSAGAKSGAAGTMAELIVTGVLSGTAVTSVASIIVAFVQRGSARSVTLEDGGRRVVVNAVSAKTQREIIERFLTGGTEAADNTLGPKP